MMDRWVEVEGRRLKLTRLDKPLWPSGTTKAELLKYYAETSEFILPYLRSRALTLHQYPDGIEGKHFVRKDAPEFTPEWIERYPYYSEHERRVINYVVCGNKATLVWFANLANIEFHVTLSRIDDFERPDLMVFDLDPFEPATFGDTVQVALVIRDGLEKLGLNSWVKTTGARGLHVLVPIARDYGFKTTRNLVRKLGSMIQQLMPEALAEFRPVGERRGKVLIDFGQNSLGKTITAPYSLKPLPGAPVSTPLGWEELEEGVEPKDFNITNVPERLKEKGDPMRSMLEEAQTLDRALEALGVKRESG